MNLEKASGFRYGALPTQPVALADRAERVSAWPSPGPACFEGAPSDEGAEFHFFPPTLGDPLQSGLAYCR